MKAHEVIDKVIFGCPTSEQIAWANVILLSVGDVESEGVKVLLQELGHAILEDVSNDLHNDDM